MITLKRQELLDILNNMETKEISLEIVYGYVKITDNKTTEKVGYYHKRNF